MAPVVCMADILMPRADAACPYARRRQRSHAGGIAGKHRAAELRQMSIARVRPASCYNTPPASPVYTPEGPIELRFPNSPESSLCARIPIERDDQWIIVKRRRGLLNIVARTIALVRRNHILEKKVEALRMETQNFLSSVLNNPGNKSNDRREKPLDCSRNSKVDDVASSSTDEESTESSNTSALENSKKKICADYTAMTLICNSTSMEHKSRTPDLLDR